MSTGFPKEIFSGNTKTDTVPLAVIGLLCCFQDAEYHYPHYSYRIKMFIWKRGNDDICLI